MNNEQQLFDEQSTQNLLKIIGAIHGPDTVKQIQEPPPADKEYHLLSAGEFADRTWRRIENPSVGIQKKVAKIGLRSAKFLADAKDAWLKHFGWNKDKDVEDVEVSKELSVVDTWAQILPLIVREDDFPDKFNVDDMSTGEAEEMVLDFLRTT